MKVLVGSQNKVKVAAAEEAFKEYLQANNLTGEVVVKDNLYIYSITL